jgi:hypothetical protein
MTENEIGTAIIEHGPDGADAFLGLRECGRDDGGIDRTANDIVERDGREDRRVFGAAIAARGYGEAGYVLTRAPKQHDHGAAGA